MFVLENGTIKEIVNTLRLYMLTAVNAIITNMKFLFALVCCKIKDYLSDVSP